MNIAARFFAYLSRVFAGGPWVEAHPSSSRMAQIFGIRAKTASGADVTESNALSLSAVWSAVRFLSETGASLPLKTYKRRANGGRDAATDHPAYLLLHDSPNPEMSAFMWREAGIGHLELHGNWYNEIETTIGGDLRHIWPLTPDTVTPLRAPNGDLYYEISENGRVKQLPPNKVLHVPGFGFDGLKGYSPIQIHREVIGLGMAMERAGSTFFGNSAIPSGILFNKGTLTKELRDENRRTWRELHGQNGKEQNGTGVLFGDWDFKTMSIPFKDAEWILGRQFGITDIARIFRVAPHILYELTRSTNNNIEHQGIENVVYSIRPRCVRIEQECNRKLFREEERGDYYVEHLIDGLLRGDQASRAAALQIMRQNGIINGDEWREIENLNPIEDGSGKAYLINGAMVPVDSIMGATSTDGADIIDGDQAAKAGAAPATDVQATALNGAQMASMQAIVEATAAKRLPPDSAKAQLEVSFPLIDQSKITAIIDPLRAFAPPAEPPPDAGPPDDAPAPEQLAAARLVMSDVMGRMVRRETQALERAARTPGEFLAKVEAFYAEHEPFMARALVPAMTAAIALVRATSPEKRKTPGEIAATHCAKHRAALLDLAGACTAKDLAGRVTEYCATALVEEERAICEAA